MRRLLRARLAEVPPSDWLLFFQAWLWLAVFDLALRTRPFRNVQALTGNVTVESPRDPDQIVSKSLQAIKRACHYHLYPMTCLRRAMALQKLLEQQGVSSELKIGVNKKDSELHAHAWVEVDGKVIGEREPVEQRYATIFGRERRETDDSP